VKSMKMRKILPSVLMLCLGLCPLLADDTDILILGAVQPNVMIILDSSGSMNDLVGGTPKITIAKQVVTDLLNNTANVRFGVMKFKANGAAMVAEIGTATATMVNAVNSMTTTSVGTPLGDATHDAGEYFKGNYSPYASPIDLACRENMIILISDGLENNSLLNLVDEATLRQTDDHASGIAGQQDVTLHTIGFAIPPGDAAAANGVLQTAAGNGGGDFYSTVDATQLQTSLEALINSVIAGSYGFAGSTFPSTGVTGNDRAFHASFTSDPARPFWEGKLSAFQRGSDGTVPTDGDDIPLSTALIWEAGTLLNSKAASSRTIKTDVGGALQNFETGNASLTAAMFGVATSGERDNIINFIRGVDAYDHDGDLSVTDQRSWKLGDILHSTPVLITPPVRMSPDPLYQTFKTAQAARTSVLLVGANDGMLHAFRQSDGDELWGFIPSDVLPKLEDLTPTSGLHPYFVDSSPVAADILISGAYETIAMFGERRGGKSYHALNVTDTTAPTYLWGFTDALMGESWSVPAIGRIEMADSTTRDVAFVGGGYDTPNNNLTGKALLVIDLATGAKLWEYYADGTTDDRQFMNYSIPAQPTLLDLDGDGFIDRVYVGDVGGQLWKFDTSPGALLTAGMINNWTGKRLFTAAPAQSNPPPAGSWAPTQAIYGAVAPALDESGRLWLYFGTGDLNDPAGASQNRFYGLRDETTMTNGAALSEASLVNVTSTDTSGGSGWYFRLASTEKVFSSADVFNGIVFFSTFTPSTVVSCDGAGTARLHGIEAVSGYAGIDWSTGEKLEPTDSSEDRSTVIGSGIPGEPSIVTTITDGVLETTVVTGTTDLELNNTTIDPVALRRILFWREVF